MKRGEVDVEMGGLPLYYFTVQLHLQCVRGWGVKFPLLHLS